MKDLISVIVPVYQVAAYLPACLDSILSQEHSALEVILIDDGSRDASGEICDEYAARDSRIRVIHQKNAGAAAAKNAGLRAATGEYLSFVDSDDYLEPGAYRHMLQLLKTYDAQAVQCAFRDVYPNHTEPQIHHPERRVLEGNEYLLRFLSDWTCALLWNKLYRRELFQCVFFEEGHKIDDEYFTYQGFLKPCRVVLDGQIVYNYRKRRSSVMNDPAAAERRVQDTLDAMTKRRERVNASCPQLRRAFDEGYLDALWYLADTPGSTEKTVDAQRQCLRRYLTQPGNTFPPRHLWKPLARMYLTPAKRLVPQFSTEDPGAEESFP